MSFLRSRNPSAPVPPRITDTGWRPGDTRPGELRYNILIRLDHLGCDHKTGQYADQELLEHLSAHQRGDI